MKTTILALSIVIASILLYSFTGKDKESNKDGTATIKIIVEKNGVRTVIDTTINFTGEFNEAILNDLLRTNGIDESNVDQKIIKTVIVYDGNRVEKKIKILCLENDSTLSQAIKCCQVNLDSIRNCCMLSIDSLKCSISHQIRSDISEGLDEKICKKIIITSDINDDLKSILEKELSIEVNEDGTTKQIIIKGNNPDMNNEGSEVKIIKKGNGEKVVIINKNINSEDSDKKESKKNNSNLSKENLKIKNLTFSPNPSNGKFNLSFNLPENGKTKITIVDSNGKTLYKEVLPDFSGDYSKDIDITNKAKGVLILNIEQGNQMTSKKLVIE